MRRGARHTGLLALLDAVVRGLDDFDLGCLDASALRHGLSVGLGPLAAHASRSAATGVPSAIAADVRGAALTGRVVGAAMMDALEAVLAGANRVGCVPLLLKGASTALRYYAKPDLRTMGDLDLLVPAAQSAAVEGALRALGFIQDCDRPAEFYAGHHHGRPFLHPVHRAWVEVHTRALDRSQPLADAAAFDARALLAAGMPSSFRGHRCLLMPAEVELAYLCSRWVEYFDVERGVWPLLDVSLLLQAQQHSFDWQALIGMVLREPLLAATVHVPLSYLARAGLARPPDDVLGTLARHDRVTNSLTRAVLCGLVDDYMMGDRPFGPLATSFNLSLVWSELQAPRPAVFNVLALPLRLAFPPGHTLRTSVARLARGLSAAVCRRGS